MIGRLRGQVIDISETTVLLDVGGVGYELEVSTAALAQALACQSSVGAAGGDDTQSSVARALTLFTHFVVREDAQQLYGFADRAERELFRTLIRVSGVGPKLALSVISGISLAELAGAVATREVARLVRIPGIGKKTAERLLVELSGKLPAVPEPPLVRFASAASGAAAEAERALVALGYRPAEAAAAIAAVIGLSSDPGPDTPETPEHMVRAALRQLARTRELERRA